MRVSSNELFSTLKKMNVCCIFPPAPCVTKGIDLRAPISTFLEREKLAEARYPPHLHIY